jgi:hypothetical protein
MNRQKWIWILCVAVSLAGCRGESSSKQMNPTGEQEEDCTEDDTCQAQKEVVSPIVQDVSAHQEDKIIAVPAPTPPLPKLAMPDLLRQAQQSVSSQSSAPSAHHSEEQLKVVSEGQKAS